MRTRSMLSVFIDFFDNNNTVEKHLFFLIQSILLFHDRCCFTFFQLVLYMYDYNDKNTVGKHLFFLIQSILLFHDRCCFHVFFFSSSYIYVRLQ